MYSNLYEYISEKFISHITQRPRDFGVSHLGSFKEQFVMNINYSWQLRRKQG